MQEKGVIAMKVLSEKEMKQIEKFMAEKQKEIDFTQAHKRMDSVMSAMISNDVVKSILVDKTYSNYCIENAISLLWKNEKIPEYLKKTCDDYRQYEINKKQEKKAKKSAAAQKASDQSNAKKEPPIDTILDMLDRGVAEGATPPPQAGRPLG